MQGLDPGFFFISDFVILLYVVVCMEVKMPMRKTVVHLILDTLSVSNGGLTFFLKITPFFFQQNRTHGQEIEQFSFKNLEAFKKKILDQ